MSGVRSAAAVSIPANVRKTIQNLKEIAGSHSDEDIYAMLKECNMDPNETAQKLLVQDPFHEVKRKRDKRKEANTGREPGDARPRTGSQTRGGRGGRGYPLRYNANDARGGRGSNIPRENGTHPAMIKNTSNIPTSQASASQTVQTKVANPVTSHQQAANSPPTHPSKEIKIDPTRSQNQTTNLNATSTQNLSSDSVKQKTLQPSFQTPVASSAKTAAETLPEANLPTVSSSGNTASLPGVYSSATDPVVVPKFNARTSGVVGTIKREVGQSSPDRVPAEHAGNSVDHKSSVPNFSSSVQAAHSDGSNLIDSDVAKVSTSVSSGYLGNRSSVVANHYSRPQQIVGSQKVGATKEWKPKPTNSSVVTNPGIIGTSTVSNTVTESSQSSTPALKSGSREDPNSKLQKKMEDLNVRDEQHIIIPDHLQVSEAERTALSFGSFDAGFGTNFGTSYDNEVDSDKNSSAAEEVHVADEEEEQHPSIATTAGEASTNEDYSTQQQGSVNSEENIASSADETIPSNAPAVSQSDAPKTEVAPPPGAQFSIVQTAPAYSGLSLVPPIIGGQYPAYEQTEPQIRDVARVPFVQPTYDQPISYYTPLIRPSSEGDARLSTFIGSTAASKFSGNLAMLSGQSVPASQESVNTLVIPNTGPSSLATQATGIVQTTPPLPQQAVPMFRQPAGVHIPHYPANYIPFHQYVSPLYVHSPAMHSFVSNGTFPQLPAGNSYPAAAAAAAAAASAVGGSGSYPPAPVKYSFPQYKPGSAGNSPHLGVPAGYGGGFASTPSGYSANPSVTSGNSSEDIGGSQFKENNVFIAGQQGEGSALWFQAPPREISSMATNSYYNMPPQGQHVQFAHTQSGHAAYGGLYHPTQSGPAQTAHALPVPNQAVGGTVGVVGAQTGVYQPSPQRPQINWNNNY
eukprot:TRINITY_DN4078_c0_g1_i1.p1 TRINITY_DN4078_c0_g1~~TRINITY_DN4078_c0_g1_i1.p1  ORF type:complete len:913 (+),score=238.17 TRINITY_DN4078_c0_g1_i1:523-3261(+)